MKGEAELRFLAAEIELREADGSPELAGVVVRYGNVATIGRFTEVMRAGSLTLDPGGVTLNFQHDRQRPLARTPDTMTLADSADAMRMTARLPKTTMADDALVLVRAKVIRGLSGGDDGRGRGMGRDAPHDHGRPAHRHRRGRQRRLSGIEAGGALACPCGEGQSRMAPVDLIESWAQKALRHPPGSRWPGPWKVRHPAYRSLLAAATEPGVRRLIGRASTLSQARPTPSP